MYDNMYDIRTDHLAAKKYGWKNVNDRGYEILERPYGFAAPRRMIGIGAGATGICLAKFAEALPNLELQIYEKNDDVAGTWLENRYPGCSCDIPSHIYQYLWALNPSWSHYYANAAEILDYFRGVARDHDLCKYVKLQHKVVHASWNASTSQWVVRIEQPDGTTFQDTCDYLVNASGFLNNWKWPNIEGLHSFKGRLVHSADYDSSLKLEGKRVAVFGAGSSGVQIVATIQPIVKHLYTWLRSPMWLTSGFSSEFAGVDGANFAYSEELKRKFADDPTFHRHYVKMLEDDLTKRFCYGLRDTPNSKNAVTFSQAQMTQKLEGRPDLLKKILPTEFGVGCRRPTPGNGYLEALMSRNVTTWTQEVQKITESGFIDNEGVFHEVDVIICATGFDTSYVPRFPILAHGRDLRQVWASDPVAYFSVMVAGFPNYFISLGPYAAANGSALPSIEQGLKYVLEIVRKCQLEYIKSIAPKQEAADHFREHSDLFLKRSVFNEKCRSWYKNGTEEGLPRVYPGSRSHFMELMNPRYEDFEIEYEAKNRYYFMGNGFATHELDGRDPTWYMGYMDGQDKFPDYSKVAQQVFDLSGVQKRVRVSGHPTEAVVPNGFVGAT